MTEKKSNIDFAIILFHEQMHNHCYKAIQITKEDSPRLKPYRSGISITTRDGEITYFEQLEEAVVQLFTKKFYGQEILTNELFKEEAQGHSPNFGEMDEYEKLDKIINDLWEKNLEQFKSKEEIENLFIDAQINGRLLPIARLIEKTFGKGSFRAVANETKYEKD